MVQIGLPDAAAFVKQYAIEGDPYVMEHSSGELMIAGLRPNMRLYPREAMVLAARLILAKARQELNVYVESERK